MALALPQRQDIAKILNILLGKNPEFKEAEAADLAQPAQGTYISHLVDDEGHLVGAIVADLTTALYLGGALIMLLEASLKSQLTQGEAPEVVVDGLSEVFNMIRGAINRIGGNLHVGYTNAQLLKGAAGEDTEWVTSPADRLDLALGSSLGEGKLILLAR